MEHTDAEAGPPQQGARLRHLEDAGVLSRLTMWWMDSLMRLGASKDLEMVDLWRLMDSQTAKHRGELLARTWAEESATAHAAGKPASLVRVWRTIHGRTLYTTGAMQFAQQLLQIAPFYVLRELLTSITEQRGVVDGLIWSVVLVSLLSVRTFVENHYFRMIMTWALELRASVMHFVYSKALVLTPTARQANSLGQMVNLMQLDTEKLLMSVAMLHQAWAGLFNIVLCVGSLIYVIGPSALAGVAIILLLIPVSGYLTNLMRRYQRDSAKFTDERVKVINEVLQGIRIIKFYSWESSFLQRIHALRDRELSKLRSKAMLKALSSVFLHAAPAFTTIATFGVYVAAGNEISKANVPVIFTALALFAQLRMPLMMYPMVLAMLSDARVSVTRLERYFALKELESGSAATRHPEAARVHVRISEGTFSWDPELTTDGSSGRLADIGAGKGKKGKKEGPKGAPAGKDAGGAGEQSGSQRRTLLGRGGKGKGKGKGSDAAAVASSVPPTGATPDKGLAPVPDAAEGAPAAAAKSGPTLVEVDFTAEPGKLTMITGAVGSGKSSLLSALLGEMRVDGGSARVDGSVAYVSQHAWILNATVRENILFFAPYDAARYDEAVALAALTHDLDALPAGDATEIGERGINLSGGQKQRISIARALYARASIVVMDDPLSALDAHVSRAIFERCIKGHLVAQGRTVLLVTNQIQFAHEADHLVVLREGRVAEAGTYVHLLARDGDFAALMRSMRTDGGKGGEEGERGAAPAEADADADAAAAPPPPAAAAAAPPPPPPPPAAKPGAAAAAGGAAGGKAGPGAAAPSGALMQREQRQRGSVKSSVYAAYFRAAGASHLALLVLLLYAANQANMVLSDAWLSIWSEGTAFPGQTMTFYLGVFVALGVTLSLLTFVRTLVFTFTGLRASNRLHERLSHVVMQGTMAFFDTTPLGRIIARFATDMNKIDETLPHAVEIALFCVFSVVATFLVISVVTPWFLLAAAPILYVYFRVQTYFKKTALDLKRLDQQARGPLYSFFSETLAGLASIRAFARQDTFASSMEARIDNSTRALWAQKMIERWLSLRLEALGNAVIGASAVAGVFAQDTYPGLIGLSLAYSFRATGLMTFMVRQVTEAQTQMTASEQILIYVNTVDTEASITEETTAALAARSRGGLLTSKADKHAGRAAQHRATNTALTEIAKRSREWLQRGEVAFEAVSMRYRPGLELVLQEVSFTIPAGAKVGVVGRTGSGKSSTMLLLMRMVEPAAGAIKIDGRDIASLSLEQLRGAISMIPQDPVLFSGTVRSNLDPFDLHADERVWTVLERVQLAAAVRAMGGLEAEVAEYGENFSVGQRQLICLARALLREGKILLMDEATSSVDYETDQLIQTLIRKEFAKATVITIAHRLNTIIDSDKILVLSDGRRAEYDAPHVLLRNEPSDSGAGILSKLVNETGQQSAAHLRQVAQAAHAQSQQ